MCPEVLTAVAPWFVVPSRSSLPAIAWHANVDTRGRLSRIALQEGLGVLRICFASSSGASIRGLGVHVFVLTVATGPVGRVLLAVPASAMGCGQQERQKQSTHELGSL